MLYVSSVSSTQFPAIDAIRSAEEHVQATLPTSGSGKKQTRQLVQKVKRIPPDQEPTEEESEEPPKDPDHGIDMLA